MTAKRKKGNRFLAEFLFWVHTVCLIIVIFSGLIVSLPWVILILILIKLQQVIFHGCLITNFEIREGGLKKGHAYFQLAAKRFLGLRIGRRGVHVVSTGLTVTSLAVALLASAYHVRLHL